MSASKYRKQFQGKCELLRYFPGTENELALPNERGGVTHVPWRKRLAQTEGLELHHICGSGNGASRVDAWVNMILVCKSIHRWLEAHKVAGFVLCCYAKRQKGELDWHELYLIKGKLLPSWLETDHVRLACEAFQWINDMRLELIRDTE